MKLNSNPMKINQLNVLPLVCLCLLLSNCTKQNQLQDGSGALENSSRKISVSASPVGDVVGKITVGYQGWFAAVGDGSPINAWWHWSNDWSKAPNNTDPSAIKSWPDVREYTSTYQTGYANLGNGQPAKLFSSFTDQTVDTHFKWMEQNGIDAAALQRFNPNGQEGPVRDAVTAKVKTAAEAHGRKFYIMYDVGGWTNMQSEIKTDWTTKMSAYTASSAYAKQNGKPVVAIWGFGFDDNNHPWSAAVCTEVINWFKSQGCYIIGGVPRHWLNEEPNQGSRPNFLTAYSAFNMLSPWLIGAIGNNSQVDEEYTNFLVPDKAYCDAHGIDYQPCVLPGDLQERQRHHGDFMWKQFYNVKRAGIPSAYISMFDEYNEGNQIAKTTENSSFVPVGSKFLSLDEDGVICSADYYLRLTNDGGKMLKGLIPLTPARPTEPVIGGGTIDLPPVGQTITLKSSNNLYVSNENGLKPMICDRTSAGGWEQFVVVDAGNGKIALQGLGKYVSSENGTQAITCNRTAIGPWEQFEWIKNTNGTVSFKSSNGQFISSENGTTAMTCSKTVAGATESFVIN